ncbi:MAG TPA: amidohydrolase family protein [Candidatus Eisenbacteria bacterium]|nr:amidohydrolase family protein [Candidatus Eisenbacteria bacterium]
MPWEPRIDLDSLRAIDVHVHAGISARATPQESSGGPRPAGVRGIQQRVGVGHQTPDETAAYYRERQMAAVIWGVDPLAANGTRPGAVHNDELLEAACRNSDVLIPFVMVDPWRGRSGVREAERLIAAGARGFKFHPPEQAFWPNDRRFYELYEVIGAHRLPALLHTGQTAVGQGAPGGGGIRLKYGNPMPLDDVAADFPDMPIILAHPSFPWQEEALSIASHKPQVYIDLSGWSPKYFSPLLVQYANTLLKHKMLFGSDHPMITAERWLGDFERAGFRDEVKPLLLKDNAARLLGLSASPLEGEGRGGGD